MTGGTPLLDPATAAKREKALEKEGSAFVDVILLAFIGAVVAGAVWFGQRSSAPLSRTVEIDLSPWALPRYALLSLLRGLIAYVFSLFFTLVYGTVAAKSRRAERVMVPLLDLLQGVPVLAFLPMFVLGMIALFPHSNLGLELACILMIFTGQVWNMTFSFYGSLRGIPVELVEVAKVNRFSWWRRFSSLELPASAIGLVWNSMMSMAGGWFFLMINEAFTLEGNDYRLPGIGSYMSVAYENRDQTGYTPIVAAIFAMSVVIIATDQLLWRPLVAWSQRFKVEEVEALETPSSWILSFIRRSRALRRMKRQGPRVDASAVATALAKPAPPPLPPRIKDARVEQLKSISGWSVAVVLFGLSGFGSWKLVGLLAQLPRPEWAEVAAALGFTSLRTVVALLLGALWTIPVGVKIGLSPRLAKRAQPVAQFLASFPAPMLFPLIAAPLVDRLDLPFGFCAIFLTLFGAQWYILFNVIAGAMTIPHDLREAADVYHVKGWARWRSLYLPGIFPHLVTGLITAAGGAWNAAIVTEYLNMGKGRLLETRGLGSMIAEATSKNYPKLAAAVLALTLTLVLLNRFVWKRLYRFADERFSLNR